MPEASTDGFKDALRREIMRSELQRMEVLVVFLAVLLVLTLVAVNFMTVTLDRFFDRPVPGWMPLAGVGPFLLYELVVVRVLRWRIGHDRDFPQAARFANALIETSLPSVIILALSHSLDPALVFGFWPPMVYFLFVILSTLRLDFWLSLWTGTVAAVELALLALWLMPVAYDAPRPEYSLLFHAGRSMVLLGAGVVAAVVANSLRRQFEKSVAAAMARDRVTNLFGQHVSPAVVDRLLAAGTEPPSELREVCVLFLDIRGFTARTRLRSPQETVDLLNGFFARMVAVVDRHQGIVNKFLGDGFLALFGAPLEDADAARHALDAARAMLDEVDHWNQRHPERPMQVGIGLHLGHAVTGTVGSPQRKEYTVIGETVNLAARLEQLTKQTGARLLVSAALREATGGADGAVDLGLLPVRGYEDGVRVWRVA